MAKTETMALRMSPALQAALRELANERGVSASEMARHIVGERLTEAAEPQGLDAIAIATIVAAIDGDEGAKSLCRQALGIAEVAK